MIEALKYRVRSWENAGRHEWLTRAATFAWVSIQNARDRGAIGIVAERLGQGDFPGDPSEAVREVCEGPFGAGIRPMQSCGELADMMRAVKASRPRRVLEIGTARGGTLFLLCRFAAPDATIVSVDLPFARNGGGYPRWKERHYRGFARPRQALHLIRANSHAKETVERVRRITGGAGFDFIFIDADHSYEGVRCDYLNYRPLLSEGGMLALHDILPNENDPSIEVNRFWRELESDPEVRTDTLIADAAQGMYGIGIVRG